MMAAQLHQITHSLLTERTASVAHLRTDREATTREATPEAALPTMLLTEAFDRRVSEAVPRLQRLARLRGVPAEAQDDVVQQTLLEAWRARDRVREPERVEAWFDAWLDAICRNVCQRYHRAASAKAALPFSSLAGEDDAQFEPPAEEDEFDPDEALDAADRARLLDRALGHLPSATRQAVEACYLADLPSGEAALRLGLSINALEVRLHRARQQLRQVLSGPLREDALSLGILLPGDESEGWRETREWCPFCGLRRMRGILEPQPGGTTRLRMRCPDCSSKYGIDIEQSMGLQALTGLSSFRPAIRRYRESVMSFYQALREKDWQRCPRCGGSIQLRTEGPGDEASVGSRWYAVITCERCEGVRASWPAVTVCSSRAGANLSQKWLNSHAHSRLEPDILTNYASVPAIRSRIVDVLTGQAVLIFSDPHVPRLLGMHRE